MELDAMVKAAAKPKWIGGYMVASVVKSMGQDRLAADLVGRAWSAMAEAEFDLVDDLVPAAPAARLLALGADATRAAETDAVPVAEIPERPRQTLRNPAHQPTKKGRLGGGGTSNELPV